MGSIRSVRDRSRAPRSYILRPPYILLQQIVGKISMKCCTPVLCCVHCGSMPVGARKTRQPCCCHHYIVSSYHHTQDTRRAVFLVMPRSESNKRQFFARIRSTPSPREKKHRALVTASLPPIDRACPIARRNSKAAKPFSPPRSLRR